MILYDLSAIDEYRTGEAAVPNNSFIIADMTFGTYGKILEDERKNEKREIIGIMPVITTAANALYQQKLIDVARENVIGFETIGQVRSLDATQISESFPKLSSYTPNALRASDSARLLNTVDHYKYTAIVFGRVSGQYPIDAGQSEDEIVANIKKYLTTDEGVKYYKPGSWDGSYQVSSYQVSS